MDVSNFVRRVWTYYVDFGRELPWRIPEKDGSFDPYKIMVSEIMLQQTQVSRVLPRYKEFLEVFPSLEKLAQASLGSVLQVWQGLGYNRRAKFLGQAARQIRGEHRGTFPQTTAGLQTLPGVGKETAGAIMAYAFNQPVVFIETNIRTVFIHEFFRDQEAINDNQLRPLIERALSEVSDYREWYWALMDYGTHLKAVIGNLSRQSQHYNKQTAFFGSKRQVRGQILNMLTQASPLTATMIKQQVLDERTDAVVQELIQEGFVVKKAGKYHLA